MSTPRGAPETPPERAAAAKRAAKDTAPAPAAQRPVPAEPPRAGLFERVMGYLVAGIPFGVALSRAASTGQWRDDLPAVRDLGLVSVGFGGGLSTLAGQALSLVPLGNRTLRTSVGSCLALSIGAYLTYRIAIRILDTTGLASPPKTAALPQARSKLAVLLAAVAALTTAVSPAWQLEGTVGGGALWATAAALGALWMALACADHEVRSVKPWLVLGALSGAAFAESPSAGLCALAAAAVALFVPRLQVRVLDRADRFVAHLLRRRVEPHVAAPPLFDAKRAAIAAFGAATATAALLLAPVALRPLAPRAWADLGRFLSATSVAALDTPAPETSALSAWSHEIGLFSLAIAIVGAAVALLRPRTRAPLGALLALVALDTLLPARLASFLSADPFAPLRCMAIAALAVACSFGVHELTLTLRRAKVPLARPASVLIVMFHVTLIALTSEEAAIAADREAQIAAEVWTDEALGALPPRAATLVRSPSIAWRLWAARIVRGDRPDVLVVPAPLLGRGHMTEALLSNERATSLLLRDIALTGSPSEHALSTLADARPLFAELFPGWSPRLFRHLSVNGLWLGYSPEPRGPSDRKLALLGQATSLERVLRAVGDAGQSDPSTGTVLAESLQGQATLLLSLGEAETAQAFLVKVAELTPKKNAVSASRGKTSQPAPDKRAR